jgi:hypothetical protein
MGFLEVSGILHGDRSGAADLGGLERELALLSWLEPDVAEDCDSVGVWYGFPMPNSAAKFKLDGIGGVSPGPAAVLDLDRLAPLGGRGLDRSGPTNGFRCASGDPPTALPFMLGLLPPGSFEGLRILESGSKGFLYAGSSPF